MSRITFLNGSSSSGKTSLAKAIQTLSYTPWLHIGIDTFIGMLPSKFFGFGDRSKEGCFFFNTSKNERGPCVQVKTGALDVKFFSDHVPHVIKLLADLGHDVIVDEVIFSKDDFNHYLHVIGGHRLHLVYVTCDFNVLKEREQLRGDRAIAYRSFL
jgi:chloramphenicol 3-O phosphotransferase